MNLDSLNKWLMLIANLGVIASIIFLAIEVQQNTTVQIANSRQQMLDAELSVIDDLSENPELYLNLRNPDLGKIDRAKRQVHWIKLLRTREFAYYQYLDGLVDEATWESYFAPMFGYFGAGPGREAIEKGFYTGSPEFKAYLMDRLSQRQE